MASQFVKRKPAKSLSQDRWIPPHKEGWETKDRFYKPSPPEPPVPPFPCVEDPRCDKEYPLCRRHNYKLIMNVIDKGTLKDLYGLPNRFYIPFGHAECWGWYKNRVHDLYQIPVSYLHFYYQGEERTNDNECAPGIRGNCNIHVFVADLNDEKIEKPDVKDLDGST